MSAARIRVGGERPYEVVVGTGVLGELPALARPASRVAVIYAAGRGEIAAAAGRVLAGARFGVRAEEIPDGEAAKDIGFPARPSSRLAAYRSRRAHLIGAGRRRAAVPPRGVSGGPR